jgi:hypothetical protein
MPMNTNGDFFIRALLGATNSKRPDEKQHLTKTDLFEMFKPTAFTTLNRIEEAMLDILANTGYEMATLDVKWGTDDEDANTPPQPKELVGKITLPGGWEMQTYTNMVQVWPRGPCSGSAGAMEVWFRQLFAPPPVFTLQ